MSFRDIKTRDAGARHPILIIMAVALMTLPGLLSGAVPITYQGQLKQSGTPVTDNVTMSFQLYDSLTGGTSLAGPQTITDVPVEDGLFQVQLDFGLTRLANIFDGSPVYLEISVDGTPLLPRQRITAAPMALSVLGGSGSNWLVSGSSLYYNDGPVGIGTTQPTAQLSVVGTGQFGASNNEASGDNSFVAGGQNNQVTGTSAHGAILGGQFNEVTGNLSAIIGGYENTVTGTSSVILAGYNTQVSGSESIASGDDNIVSGSSSAVIGAADSEVTDSGSFIGGGRFNAVTASRSGIIAGVSNEVTSGSSVIAGGRDNVASGSRSFIAAGGDNFTDGANSFAGGVAAHALHNGTFVWSDSSDTPFASTAEDQFLVYATGGVGFGRAPLLGDGGENTDWFEIDAPFGTVSGDAGDGESAALRVRLDGSTRLRLLRNGGLAVGDSYRNSGVPERGLRVSGQTLLESEVTINDDLEVNGDVSQPGSANGLVKASALVNCSGGGSSSVRFFNNVTGTLTVTGDGGSGGCFINFNFSLSDRYWQVSAADDGSSGIPSADYASCARGPATILRCVRRDSSGNASSGGIMITVY